MWFILTWEGLGFSQVVLVVRNLPANTGDVSWISGSGRSPEAGNGNLLQYSCLENPMDRGAWQAIVQGVAKSQTRLKLPSSHPCFRCSKLVI